MGARQGGVSWPLSCEMVSPAYDIREPSLIDARLDDTGTRCRCRLDCRRNTGGRTCQCNTRWTLAIME